MSALQPLGDQGARLRPRVGGVGGVLPAQPRPPLGRGLRGGQRTAGTLGKQEAQLWLWVLRAAGLGSGLGYSRPLPSPRVLSP